MRTLAYFSQGSVRRKGITPVIAVLLLLMMTVAAAGGAYVWIEQLQGQLQEQSSEQVQQSFSTDISLKALRCENTGGVGKIEALLKNAGESDLDIDPVDVDVYDSSSGELNLSISHGAVSLTEDDVNANPEITINPANGDFSEAGRSANYIIDLADGHRFREGYNYRVEFVFTAENERSVRGSCQP